MEPEKKSNGAFIGLIIIIIILIAGGVYIWQENKKAAEKIKTAQVQAEAILNQDSAALDSLDQELQTTDTNVGVDSNNIN
jgi:type II secretory pathway pseudopilin PulG